MIAVIAAGVLSLPGLTVLLVTAPLVGLLSLPAAWLLLSRKSSKAIQEESAVPKGNSHVIVTGGSSGIGLAIACEAAKQHGKWGIAKVTILARNEERLQAAKKQIEAACGNDKVGAVTVSTLSVDVTNAEALQKAAKDIMENDKSGKTSLFCCAGEAYPERFTKLTSETFVKQVQVNQLGCIFTVHAFLPYMQVGTITLCSSVCGQVGIYGYSAYTPAKFALRGFAEVLHAELCSQPIHVQVAYPPDTQTPGFERENITKPKPTRLISEHAALYQPETIGRKMLYEAMQPNPRFAVYFDMDGWIVSNLTAGFAPVTNWMDAVAQVSLSSLLRWVLLFYVKDFHRIIQKCDQEEDEEIKRKNS